MSGKKAPMTGGKSVTSPIVERVRGGKGGGGRPERPSPRGAGSGKAKGGKGEGGGKKARREAAAARERQERQAHESPQGAAKEQEPGFISPIDETGSLAEARAEAESTEVKGAINHRVTGQVVHGSAAKKPQRSGLTPQDIIRKGARKGYMGAEGALSSSENAGTQSVGVLAKGVRRGIKGVRAIPRVYTTARKGVKTAIAAPGRAARAGARTAANARAVVGHVRSHGVRRSLIELRRRAGMGVKARAVKAGRAMISIPGKMISAIAGASGALVLSLLSVVAVISIIGILITAVSAVFSGDFSEKDDAGEETEYSMSDYLMARIIPLRASLIADIRETVDKNLAENGGDYHIARVFSTEDAEEVPYDQIEGLVYPADSLAAIIQPVFWTLMFDEGLFGVSSRAAESALSGIWDTLAGFGTEELPIEYCEEGIHAACGHRHAAGDCPNSTEGTHGSYTCGACCAETWTCNGHSGGAPSDPPIIHSDPLSDGCDDCEHAFSCSGYRHCGGHRVLAVNVRMDGIHELLFEYYTDPIDRLASVANPTADQQRELQELRDGYELCLDFLAEVNALFGYFGGSADLSGIEFIAGSRAGSQAIIDIAISQVGQTGGEPYWKWQGHSKRVSWCGIFVSWCFSQAGKSEPRFEGVQRQGVTYFKSAGLWRDAPQSDLAPGDVIFLDWDQDGWCDHTGLVIGRDADNVYTVEGNSGDTVRIKAYSLASPVIAGYGFPAW